MHTKPYNDGAGGIISMEPVRASPRRTSEFDHYEGCRHRDPDNCSGCALTTGGDEGPNYAAWPLAYIENHRTIPAKWRKAFARELQSDNKLYADNIRAQIAKHGVRFSDGKPL